jgi:hypothetical protein
MIRSTQPLHRTWPHGRSKIAEDALVRAFLQDGQDHRWAFVSESVSEAKLSVTNVDNEYECGLSTKDLGHCGVIFWLPPESANGLAVGVSDGIQNDFSTGLRAAA